MPTYRPAVTCLVAGTPTPILEAHAHEAVNEVGTATVVLALPVPAHVAPNAVVQLVGSMADAVAGVTESATIFQGQTRGPVGDELSTAGALETLQAQGWLALMDLPHHEDVAFPGPVSLRDCVVGLFADRAFGLAGRPSYSVDDLVGPDGAVVTLGGVAEIDDGQVRVKAGGHNSYFKWIADACNLFGYAVYENGGQPRVSRIFGQPVGDSVRAFVEGVDGFRWRGETDLHGVVTWWEAHGPSWTDADGQQQAIRSFPAAVPPSPDIPDPPSVTRDDVSSDLLVTQDLADGARNVREIEYGVRRRLATWTVNGCPTIRPGHVVTLDAPTVGLSGEVWVYSVSHDWTVAEGYTTTITGSFGGGDPLPAGADLCVTETVLAGPTHVGDEVVPWYAVDAPTGSTITVNFTPLDDYTSITLVGRHHGTNSQFIDSVNTDLTVSRWELWQGGELIGDGTMPVADENYALQLDYTDDANWSDFSVPIPGTLEGGVAAVLYLISGVNPALPPATDDDDFEVKNVVLTSCQQGAPALPTEPTTPTVPPAQPPPPDCPYSGGGSVGSGVPLVIAASATWPAGYRYCVMTASASGLTGLPTFGGANPLTAPAQAFSFGTAGGQSPMVIPGTASSPNPADTGTVRVGSGTVAAWADLGAPSSGPISMGTLQFSTGLDTNTAIVPFAVANVCVRFVNAVS